MSHTSMRVRVLVADGNVDSADSLAVLLELWGYEACVAYTGPSALQMAREFAPEYVITDIALPKLDGLQLARQLHGQAVLIAATGLGQEVFRCRSREAGFKHFLVKPVEPEELRRLLARESCLRNPPGRELPDFSCCELFAGAC